MMHGNGQLSVPPGFRFHPTDEELLYYYLKKKVSYEAIDLDVIIEVDLNKLEPWDLKEKCRIGSGPQNEWYFFSHKDKKYPTGTRTNRATTAGFWKATGRDKAIYLSNGKRIGMRKTLVFYTGRAPHGQKTDWIMHEYRLDDNDDPQVQQEDGWVVCRVFKKKNHGRGIQHDEDYHENPAYTSTNNQMMKPNNSSSTTTSVPNLPPRQHHDNYNIQPLILQHPNNININMNYPHNPFDGVLHLPQLSSPDSVGPNLLSSMDNLVRMTPGSNIGMLNNNGNGNGNAECSTWGFLDKLLAGYQSLDQHQVQQQQQQQQHQQQQQQQEKGCLMNTTAAAADHIVGINSTSAAIRQNKLPFL